MLGCPISAMLCMLFFLLVSHHFVWAHLLEGHDAGVPRQRHVVQQLSPDVGCVLIDLQQQG